MDVEGCWNCLGGDGVVGVIVVGIGKERGG